MCMYVSRAGCVCVSVALPPCVCMCLCMCVGYLECRLTICALALRLTICALPLLQLVVPSEFDGVDCAVLLKAQTENTSRHSPRHVTPPPPLSYLDLPGETSTRDSVQASTRRASEAERQ